MAVDLLAKKQNLARLWVAAVEDMMAAANRMDVLDAEIADLTTAIADTDIAGQADFLQFDAAAFNASIASSKELWKLLRNNVPAQGNHRKIFNQIRKGDKP